MSVKGFEPNHKITCVGLAHEVMKECNAASPGKANMCPNLRL